MNITESYLLIGNVILLIGIAVTVRLYYLIALKYNKPKLRLKDVKSSAVIVMGSGGHTAEMMTLLKSLEKRRYCPRFYLVAESDKLSQTRVLQAEEDAIACGEAKIVPIYRSRKVHQSYFSSVFTTLVAIFQCFWLIIFKIRPDLILCNGPGTCVPVCIAAFVGKVFFVNKHCKIVFIESFCRTKTISLTGKILLPIADLFVAQWPYLTRYSDKIQYYGNLNFTMPNSESS